MWDITPAVTMGLKVWPGDTPPAREVLCRIEDGANITLSTLRATVHLGAHADGPNHYAAEREGATGIGERALDSYIGPCRVVGAKVARGARVRVEDLVFGSEAAGGGGAGGLELIREPRVLIRTGTFPDPEAWNDDFAGVSVELVHALAGRGVRTLGIDTPSVDLFASKDLEAHRAIFSHDISILEGLRLDAVPLGVYELIALPLKLMGFDASPVRAILRKIT